MVIARNILAGFLLLAAAAGLPACGKRGDLTPPDGSTYPQQYPKQ
jgi:predicted small lipoprotein YifL